MATWNRQQTQRFLGRFWPSFRICWHHGRKDSPRGPYSCQLRNGERLWLCFGKEKTIAFATTLSSLRRLKWRSQEVGFPDDKKRKKKRKKKGKIPQIPALTFNMAIHDVMNTRCCRQARGNFKEIFVLEHENHCFPTCSCYLLMIKPSFGYFWSEYCIFECNLSLWIGARDKTLRQKISTDLLLTFVLSTSFE